MSSYCFPHRSLPVQVPLLSFPAPLPLCPEGSVPLTDRWKLHSSGNPAPLHHRSVRSWHFPVPFHCLRRTQIGLQLFLFILCIRKCIRSFIDRIIRLSADSGAAKAVPVAPMSKTAAIITPITPFSLPFPKYLTFSYPVLNLHHTRICFRTVENCQRNRYRYR